MQKLTKQQAIVVTGYTGFLACKFDDFHEDIENRLGRPVFTHEMGNKDFMENTVRKAYEQDFLRMCYE